MQKKNKESSRKKTARTTETRLSRSETNRVLGGVAAGIAEYVHIDPTVIRIIFILLGLFGGSGLLLYLALWIVMPSASSLQVTTDPVRENITEIHGKTQQLVASLRNSKENTTRTGALLLIGIGILLVLNNFGIYVFNFGKMWPFLLILLGIVLLRRK